ncbi:MAG: acyltransferase [Deltaproteobacteria bacterium]|nr:acyltransferase [Deltaproteobacteria bacterium]MBI3391444.1 acyltransferase [Deltaproteobacteria bacterium]
MMVVAGHIGHNPRWAGSYAVFGFYMLSGFLMTNILHEAYGLDAAGMRRYFVNRALRIYPAYWCALLLSIFAVALAPQSANVLNPVLHMPSSLLAWVSNASLFGLTIPVPQRLVPPAWSLNVELSFYIALPLLLCRWRVGTVIWFAISSGYTAYMVYQGRPFLVRYAPLAAASLPFSIGALVWHFRRALPSVSTPLLGVAFVAYLANLSGARVWWTDPKLQGFYVSLALSSVLLVGLSQRTTARPWLQYVDRQLGRLSYPIFLLHWTIATLVAATGAIAPTRGGMLFCVTIVPLNLTAFAVASFVEGPVERFRTRVRARAPR